SAQALEFINVSRRWTVLLTSICLGLEHPTTQRLRTDIKLRSQSLAGCKHGRILREPVNDHADGTVTNFGGVFLGHDCYLSQKRQRHQTRDGSSCQFFLCWALMWLYP